MIYNYHFKRKKWTTIALALMMLLAAPTALVAADESNGEGTGQGQGMGDNNSTLPDMTISDIYLDDNNILSIEVSNIGIGDVPAAEADSGTVYIWINQFNQPDWTYSWFTLADTSFVNAGGIADVQPQLLVGMNYVKACVDVHDAIVESDENNNCLISNLTSVEDIDEIEDNFTHDNNSDDDNTPVMDFPDCPPGTSTSGTGAHVKLWLPNGFLNCYYINQEDKTGPTFDDNGMQTCSEGTSYYGTGDHVKLWLLNGGFVNCYILEGDDESNNNSDDDDDCESDGNYSGLADDDSGTDDADHSNNTAADDYSDDTIGDDDEESDESPSSAMTSTTKVIADNPEATMAAGMGVVLIAGLFGKKIGRRRNDFLGLTGPINGSRSNIADD
ncbi:MAG: hypothetical protein QF831_04850 [Candidatus Thalassarchaeaceae archaeon]|nr:hypothetical protein [Candidatus Thalassarchaeaceae archaeon]